MKHYGITGWKNCGKTGLMERLVTHFTGQGLRVSTIKHTHHAVDLEVAGTDTHRHRVAGADQVMLASASRSALLTEHRDAPEPELRDLLAQMAPVDLVLVEGFKSSDHPKVEAHRAAAGTSALLAETNTTIRAVASDSNPSASVPVFDLDDTAAIAAFIAQDLGL
ncbi:molybdopterin-guanine dinucleotide biosynthesis protein MobB [Thalassobacter stenotrophicus]|uniref:molybdopterin-guanine dinucleotide biosynthesis protein B n=1 Tax=Thalassobacter TaxID=266808 RepID=UPI00051DDCF8|nr:MULTISPECIES: molybdopterin-guanine dinucleotide biosynthesis protein B [Thalassobacter]KGK80474.1 molybdopterin-guanine dinucleotide biosynthesis protein MobB [Thalassobacter stenotrophicus]KGL01857.1 molybdopterin-guanine dinucleotide biosynthesis protein MobB [Thalassobacter sp. 16PALIMAR09]